VQGGPHRKTAGPLIRRPERVRRWIVTTALLDDRVLDLPDGTSIGLYEYGDPAGRPVLVFHGVPACGAGFAWADEPARERGLRLLAPDRPGIGRSSGPALDTVSDYPARIATLADALGLDRFGVWGYSGGGPYAVACAGMLGARVTATAVASGMGQMGVWAEADDFAKTDRQMLGLAPKHPGVARTMLGVSAWLAKRSPKSALKSFAKELSPSDRELLPDLGPPEEVMALFTRAFQRGAGGVVDDYVTLAQPWGCPIEADGAVTIWQGDADTMVPLRHARALAERLPKATLTIWPGEGHLGPIAHVADILDTFG
jgi:pimeloyl-ACP methyl ester carboxylesterase